MKLNVTIPSSDIKSAEKNGPPMAPPAIPVPVPMTKYTANSLNPKWKVIPPNGRKTKIIIVINK